MEDFKKIKQEILKNKKVKKAYEELAPEFNLIATIIKKRIEKGLSQEELACKIGTKQSAISRLESGAYNPSLAFLQKVASALGASVKVLIS